MKPHSHANHGTCMRGFARSGFTLIELITSLAIMSILLGAMVSVIMIAAQALPNPDSRQVSTVDAGRIIDEIAADLICAVTVTTASATEIEFAVADRDNDGLPETIRYFWSGTPGDPLTRQYNGGATVSVAENVQEFDLTYNTLSSSVTTTQTSNVESDEVLFASFTGWPGIPGTVNYRSLSPTNWACEFFEIDQVNLPATTNQVRITRAMVKLKAAASGSTVSIGIHRSVGGGNPQPASNSLGLPTTVTAPVSGSGVWTEVTFANTSVNNLNKEFVIVVKGTGAGAVDLEYLHSTAAPKDLPMMLWTTDGGGKWGPKKNVQNENDIPFYVWGTFTTSETIEVTVNTNTLTSIDIRLNEGPDTATRAETAVQMLNRPELPN